MGQTIVKRVEENVKDELVLDLSGFQNGIYYLNIRTNSGTFQSKIVKD